MTLIRLVIQVIVVRLAALLVSCGAAHIFLFCSLYNKYHRVSSPSYADERLFGNTESR